MLDEWYDSKKRVKTVIWYKPFAPFPGPFSRSSVILGDDVVDSISSFPEVAATTKPGSTAEQIIILCQ